MSETQAAEPLALDNLETQPPGASPRWCFWFWATLLVLGIGAVYLQSYQVPFLFDDVSALPENTHLRTLWPLWNAMVAPPQSTLAGRPVVALSFALNYQISGLNPWSYHLGNNLLHLANALLLLLLLRLTFTLPALRPLFAGAGPTLAAHAAGASALLWAVHPLLSEAVVYTVQRTELLATFFCLGALYGALRSFTTRRPLVWQTLAVACCALGMATKEVVAGLPLLILLADHAIAGGSWFLALRRRTHFYLYLAGTWLIMFAILLTAPRSGSVSFQGDITPLSYFLTQLRVLTFYLRTVFWPDGLALYHEVPRVESLLPVLPHLLLLMLILGGSLFLLTRPGGASPRRGLGFLGLWAAIILAPSSSFIPILTEYAAERRMYMPLMAIVIAVVLLGVRGIRRLEPALAAMALALPAMGLAALLGILTIQRVEDYRTEISIWQAAIREYPHSAMLRNFLAMAYEKADRPEDAYQTVIAGIDLNPAQAHPELYSNLGRYLRDRGDPIGAEHAYRQALGRMEARFGQPRHHEAWLGLARLALDRKDLTQALQLVAESRKYVAESHESYIVEGLIYKAQGQNNQAIQCFLAAIQRKPTSPEANYQLAQTFALLGQRQTAARIYLGMIQRNPHDAAAQLELGALFLEAGQLTDAARHFRVAVEAQPNQYIPRARLAWTLAVNPRSTPAELALALTLAREAVALSQEKEPSALDALAAAHARLGQFDQAVQAVTKVIDISRQLNVPPALLQRAESRLQLYATGQPYLQQPSAPTPPVAPAPPAPGKPAP